MAPPGVGSVIDRSGARCRPRTMSCRYTLPGHKTQLNRRSARGSDVRCHRCSGARGGSGAVDLCADDDGVPDVSRRRRSARDQRGSLVNGMRPRFVRPACVPGQRVTWPPRPLELAGTRRRPAGAASHERGHERLRMYARQSGQGAWLAIDEVIHDDDVVFPVIIRPWGDVAARDPHPGDACVIELDAEQGQAPIARRSRERDP